MKRFSITVSVVGIAALILPLGLMAKDHDERAPLADVWIMVPKQGMEAQFEEAVKAHMAHRAEAEDSRYWAGFRVVIGHNPSIYQWRYCCFNWADQDAYVAEENEKGFNEHWSETVHQYVDHYHHYLDRMDYENSHWPEDEDTGPYYGVTSWVRKQGAGPGSEEARKQMSQVALKEGWAEAGNRWLWHSSIGGKPTQKIVTSFENYADMAPPEQSFYEFMSEHMDSEEDVAALFNAFGSGFSSSDYTVWMHDTGLSTPSDDE